MSRVWWLLIWNLHIWWLLVKSGIRLSRTHSWLHNAMHIKAKVVDLAPIIGPISYITALHEFGHLSTHHMWGNFDEVQKAYNNLIYKGIVDPIEREMVLLTELMANEWAIKNAIRYDKVMGRTLQTCLNSYYPKKDPLSRLMDCEFRVRHEVNYVLAPQQSSFVSHFSIDSDRILYYRSWGGSRL